MDITLIKDLLNIAALVLIVWWVLSLISTAEDWLKSKAAVNESQVQLNKAHARARLADCGLE